MMPVIGSLGIPSLLTDQIDEYRARMSKGVFALYYISKERVCHLLILILLGTLTMYPS